MCLGGRYRLRATSTAWPRPVSGSPTWPSPPTSSSASRARPRTTSNAPSKSVPRRSSTAPIPSSSPHDRGPVPPTWTTAFSPSEVTVERMERLRAVVERRPGRKHAARVGRSEEVVVEGRSKRDPSVTTGRTGQNKLVHFAAPDTGRPIAPGSYATVRVTDSARHHLCGELVEATACTFLRHSHPPADRWTSPWSGLPRPVNLSVALEVVRAIRTGPWATPVDGAREEGCEKKKGLRGRRTGLGRFDGRLPGHGPGNDDTSARGPGRSAVPPDRRGRPGRGVHCDPVPVCGPGGTRRHRLAGQRCPFGGGTGLDLRSITDDLRFPGRFAEAAARLTDGARRRRPLGLEERAACLVEDARPPGRNWTRWRRVGSSRATSAVWSGRFEVTLGSGQPFSSFGPGLERYPAVPGAAGGAARRPRRDGPADRGAVPPVSSTRGSSTRPRPWRARPTGTIPDGPPGPWLPGTTGPRGERKSSQWTRRSATPCSGTGQFARRQWAWFLCTSLDRVGGARTKVPVAVVWVKVALLSLRGFSSLGYPVTPVRECRSNAMTSPNPAPDRQLLRFTKHHGAGNDFLVLIDPGSTGPLPGDLVRALCDRQFGVGADGVIQIVACGTSAEVGMILQNADGREAGDERKRHEVPGPGRRVERCGDPTGLQGGDRHRAPVGGVLRRGRRPCGPKHPWTSLHSASCPDQPQKFPDRRVRTVDMGNPHVVMLGPGLGRRGRHRGSEPTSRPSTRAGSTSSSSPWATNRTHWYCASSSAGWGRPRRAGPGAW